MDRRDISGVIMHWKRNASLIQPNKPLPFKPRTKFAGIPAPVRQPLKMLVAERLLRTHASLEPVRMLLAWIAAR